ncbi:MAG: RHS repeat domain-containing protein [Akkermansiaceae bacterium]
MWNDKASLVDQITFPSGARQSKEYDELGRLKLIEAYNQANTQINSFDYTYNSVGQREDVTLADGSKIDYTYDQLRQLDTAKKTDAASNPVANYDYDYNFDAIGNRTTVLNAGANLFTYAPNQLNQYSQINPSTGPPVTPTYDNNGSLLSDGRISNTWNEENRLEIIVDEDKGTRSEYLYDAYGRRTERNDYNTTSGGAAITTTRYLYESWNCLAEFTVQNAIFTMQKSYTWGLDLSGSAQGAGGVGGLLSVRDHNSGINHSVTYDGNGNVSDLINIAGVVTAHYEYDPFGNTLVKNGSFADGNTYRFSTKPINIHAGSLYYYGYRYYDPVTGRWPSRDLIQERGGLNLYGFVHNDGVNRADFMGLNSYSESWSTLWYIGEKILGIELDQFGRKCCGKSMLKVSVLYHPTVIKTKSAFPFAELVDPGHASIVTPNITAGLWPGGQGAGKSNPSAPGDLNTIVADEGLDDHTHVIDFKACPESIFEIETWIKQTKNSIDKGKNPFGGKDGEEYNFMNGNGGKSCIGFVCEAISQAGGNFPVNPTPENPIIPDNILGSQPIKP